MSIGGVTAAGSGYADYPAEKSYSPPGPGESSSQEPKKKHPGNNNTHSPSSQKLTKEEDQEVAKLRQRDQEVRAHEAAHMSAGGGSVRGGASYSYQSGPDGKRYAVGGEVGIDTSPVKDNPNATIAKMQQVRAAALAPANPSGQDRAVAAAASAQETAARMQLNTEKKAASPGSSTSSHPQKGYDKRGKSQDADSSSVKIDIRA